MVRSEFFLPEGLTGVGIDADEFAGEVGGVNAIFNKGRRAGESDVVVVAPHFHALIEDELLGRVFLGDVDANEATFGGGVDVFLAVEGDELVLIKNDL